MGFFSIPGLLVSVFGMIAPSSSRSVCPEDDGETRDWWDVCGLANSLGLRLRAGEKAAEASDGTFLELSLGLGVSTSGEVGLFNEETEDRVLLAKEDGGDDPRLIKTRSAPGS